MPSLRWPVRASGVLCLVALALASPAVAQISAGTVPEGGYLFATEENPPFNYTDKDTGRLAGVAADIVQEMVRRAGVTVDYVVLPWARAFRAAQTTRNVCVFATTITEERRPQFAWVTPLATGGLTIFARHDWDGGPLTVEDLRGRDILIQRDGPAPESLKDTGATIRGVPLESVLPMLAAGRADLVALGAYSGPWRAKREGVKIKNVLQLSVSELGLACNLDSDPAGLDRLRAALATMAEDGTITAVMENYR